VRDYSRLEATTFSRDRVAALSVLVVGAGALGNEVIKNLVLLGVGRLSILDRDAIEPSNLTRSVLFCVPDINDHIAKRTPKALFAARRARELNPDVDAVAHVGEVADLGLGIVRRADVVFSCLDNEMARLELSWTCARLDKPLVDGGLGHFNASSGLVSLFPGSDGPCYACRKSPDRRRELLVELQGREDPCGLKERLQQAAAVVATTPVMASVVGAIQVEVGIRHLLARQSGVRLSSGLSHRITLHPRATLETFQFDASPNCPLHEAGSLVRDVCERRDRVSTDWTAGELLRETAQDTGFLAFDWPMTARASCRRCGHEWSPMLRRARFRRAHCPACDSADLSEKEVLSGVDRASAWADRSLDALGLPRAHVHEIVLGSDPDGPRRHVEITGDLLAVTQERRS